VSLRRFGFGKDWTTRRSSLRGLSLFAQSGFSKDRRVNWLAIVCAGAAYWILGALWYSKLFSKPWVQAIERHGIKLQPRGMAMKLIVTFVANLIAAIVLARLFHQLQVIEVLRGIKIGAAVGVGFAA